MAEVDRATIESGYDMGGRWASELFPQHTKHAGSPVGAILDTADKITTQAAQLDDIHRAYDGYMQALRERKHGAVAANHFTYRIAEILGRSPNEFQQPAKD